MSLCPEWAAKREPRPSARRMYPDNLFMVKPRRTGYGCKMTQTREDRQEFLDGFRDIVPLSLGAGIYGLAFGLLAAQAQMRSLEVGVMGTVVFAGASQIVAVERLVAGAGSLVAVLAGLALNLRLLLITASVREIYAGRPFWQVALGAHLTTDENWALMLSTLARGRRAGYWYLVGAGCNLMGVWVLATVAGVYFASAIAEPRALGMDFAFTAAFIAIARSLWGGRRDLLPWATSFGVVALLVLTGAVDASWALIAGGVSGAAVAGVLRHD